MHRYTLSTTHRLPLSNRGRPQIELICIFKEGWGLALLPDWTNEYTRWWHVRRNSTSNDEDAVRNLTTGVEWENGYKWQYQSARHPCCPLQWTPSLSVAQTEVFEMSARAWNKSSFPSLFNAFHSFLMTPQLFRDARCATQLGRWMWREHTWGEMDVSACVGVYGSIKVFQTNFAGDRLHWECRRPHFNDKTLSLEFCFPAE